MADNTAQNGTATIAADDIAGVLYQRVKPVHGLADVAPIDTSTTNPLPVALTEALPAGANAIGTTLGPTLTKATQGTTGYSVQDLKDSGRVYVVFTATAITMVTAEALVTMTPYRDLVAGSAATTHAVTSGKRLRIQTITVTARATSTVNNHGMVRLRMLAGTVLVGSPVHHSLGVASSNITPAVIGHALSETIHFPDGLELSGTMQLGLTQLFSAVTGTIDVHIAGFEY